MNNFFKQVLAVIVGMTFFQVIATAFSLIFIFIVIAAMDKEVKMDNNSVLWMDLAYDIPEADGFTTYSLSAPDEFPQERIGLQTMLQAIETAKTDDQIKGIYLDVSMMPNGYATVEVIRDALLDFKESGKFIVAYGEVMAQKSYYLSSVADKIYLNPQGVLEIRGIGTRLTFFHKLLTEKLDAEVQVFKVGTFKSAVEPFIREDASEENKEQLTFLLQDIKDDFLNNISLARNLDVNELDDLINNLSINSAQDAVDYGLVDGTWYYDEVLSDLAARTGTDKVKNLSYISIQDYALLKKPAIPEVKNKIAVIYAEGDIVDGKGDEGSIGGERFARIVRNLRQDDNIKAIVLRINSGGGSALASEVMWREFEMANKNIPFVVSMGDVAASGGYYIACNADKIYAEENTITGSIGVFGLVPNFENFFNNKLGVTFDEVTLNEHATMDGVTEGFDPYEAQVIQTSVNEVYETFTTRVAEGRNMPIDTVLKYGEGRVWTGEQAIDIGLVDEIGGLNDAIAYAAQLAAIDEYRTSVYPKIKSPWEVLLEDLSGEKSTSILEKELGEYYVYIEQMQRLKEMQKGVQARLPYVLEIY